MTISRKISSRKRKDWPFSKKKRRCSKRKWMKKMWQRSSQMDGDSGFEDAGGDVEKLIRMEERLRQRVVGQEEALPPSPMR
jgi:ATP-dependent Clp protease ATP-binding subunit ClpA